MSDVRIRRFCFAFASLVVGLGASAALFELALRIVDWPSPGLYRDGMGPLPLSIATEEGSSWRRYPGTARLRHWDYDVEIPLNAHGFVERENTPKPAGTWRIGLFGDSFAAGMGVTVEERFGSVWQRSLPPDVGRSVELYNFGSAWSGTGQSAAFLAGHGAEYALDEVVLALFGGNELQDNEMWEQYRELPPDERARRDQPRRSWRDQLRNRSRAAGFLYVSLVRGFASRQVTVPTRAFVDEHWPPTARALARFAEATAPRPLTIWYLPSTTEWDDGAWREMRDALGLSDDDRHAVKARVQQWASDAGVPFVDTTPSFAGARASAVIFPRDGHWNAAGHDRVGRHLAAVADASHRQRVVHGD